MEEQSHYKRHRYPKTIIHRCVWLYYNFMLSFRDIALVMFERGIIVRQSNIGAKNLAASMPMLSNAGKNTAIINII